MMMVCCLRFATVRHAFSMWWPYQSMTLTSSVMDPFLFRVPLMLWTGTGFGKGWVSSLCFWLKAWLMNIPVAPESRRADVEMDHRVVVVQSSMAMLRVQADLDKMYIDGRGTVGGSGDTDTSFPSNFPHI